MMRGRIYGVPCFAWHIVFFVALGNSFGTFVSMDETTSHGMAFDFAIVTMKVKLSFIFQPLILVENDGKIFVLTLCEDSLYQQCSSGISVSQITELVSLETLDSDEAWLNDSFKEKYF